MRPVKLAIAAALAADAAVAELVPATSVYAVERATVPTLPSIEVIGVSSELVDTGPLVRHQLSIEVTVRRAAEDAADEASSAIVRAVRRRLADAENDERVISEDRRTVVVGLQGTRWSMTAASTSGVIRGAAISLTVSASE